MKWQNTSFVLIEWDILNNGGIGKKLCTPKIGYNEKSSLYR